MDMPTRKRVAEEVRRQHLGEQSKPKRVVLKASDKSRFCADWPLSDDTSPSPHDTFFFEAPLLFGRGFLAGFDRPEQKKTSTYWSDKKLSDMTPRDWRIFEEDFNILYKGSPLDRPHPMRNWEESELSHNILKAVQKSGYKKPTPIQMAAIPIGLAHRDAIGVAETGSGKTASFVLPMLHHVASLPPLLAIEGEVQGPHALILAPTRELAQQIEEVIVRLSRYLHVKAVLIVGGHSIEQQGMQLSQGCDIIIATPGRLIDCLERRLVVLNQCNYVILDEADRMVAMGFEEQVVGILNSLPKDISSQRTMCMFSATMPSAVERITRRFLTDPVIINVGVGKATDSVTQRVFMVNDSEKLKKLRALLDGHKLEKLMMIFVNSRNSADSLVRRLEQLGYGATSLHGGMSQEQREASLKKFKSGQYKCLVATDILGRGIDIQGVAHVVNYEMPETIETYTHRIGRTGRAGNSGFATTFLTLSDSAVFYDLKQFLIENKSHVPPELAHHEASKHKPGTFRL